jgi:hypothetical protein
MQHRPLLGALAATALAVAVAACGGASHDATTPQAAAKPAAPVAATPAAPTGPAPTKAAYVTRADSVCRDARGISRRANAVVLKAYQANQAGAAADAIDHYVPVFAAKIAELHALRRPQGDAKVLNGLLRVMDAEVTSLSATSRALRADDGAQLQQLGKLQQRAQQYADALGKQYGFKVCGRVA